MLGSLGPTGSCQHLPEAQSHMPWHVQALPQPEIHRSRAGAGQPPRLGSLPVPRALPRAGGTAPAPRLMRWLPVLVNHLPGRAAGLYLNSSPHGRAAVRSAVALSPRAAAPSVLQEKNPKPHESSRVSCFTVSPNSGLPGVSVILSTFPTNLQ